MVLLVGISTFSKSPLIGGETCVQIAFAIWTRFFQDLFMGPVYLMNIESLTNTNYLYGGTKYAFESTGCYRSSDAWGLTWLTPDVIPNRYWMPFPGGSFLSIHFEGSYWMQLTGAIPGLPNLASQWDYSDLVGAELVMSKTDCGDWPPRGSRGARVRRVWDGARCPNCRHVAFESNRSGMVKSEKGSDFEALRTGVRYSTLPSRYMGGELTMAGWMYCETCFLRMNLLVPPVETSATNL